VAKKTELQVLEAQLIGARAQIRDPDAANKAALAETRAQLADAEAAVRQFDGVLVSPQRAPQLLQSLLVQHRGLELLALSTLPPMPLMSAPAAPKDGKPEAPPAAAPRAGQIQKHGIEVRVAGGYLDLLAYVSELENLPQKLIWGRMALEVKAYPRSELTLTLYTLSLDTTWLVV
jgi:MSHA biogenesis protein MshJ